MANRFPSVNPVSDVLSSNALAKKPAAKAAPAKAAPAPVIVPAGAIPTPGHASIPAPDTVTPPPVVPFTPPPPGEDPTPPVKSDTPPPKDNPPPPPPGPPAAPPLDWRAYLTNWGFDATTVGELDRLFRTYTDPNQAALAALAYIRGTDWYKKTFPGIQQGINNGIVGNESDYRSYTNQLTQIYRSYLGRDVSANEVSDALTKGVTASDVGRHFQGQAYVGANKTDIQGVLGHFGDNGELSESDLGSYGDFQAGLTNMVGPAVQRALQIASQRLSGVFQGTLAQPGGLGISKLGRLSAPSLSGGISNADVGA